MLENELNFRKDLLGVYSSCLWLLPQTSPNANHVTSPAQLAQMFCQLLCCSCRGLIQSGVLGDAMPFCVVNGSDLWGPHQSQDQYKTSEALTLGTKFKDVPKESINQDKYFNKVFF